MSSTAQSASPLACRIWSDPALRRASSCKNLVTYRRLATDRTVYRNCIAANHAHSDNPVQQPRPSFAPLLSDTGGGCLSWGCAHNRNPRNESASGKRRRRACPEWRVVWRELKQLLVLSVVPIVLAGCGSPASRDVRAYDACVARHPQEAALCEGPRQAYELDPTAFQARASAIGRPGGSSNEVTFACGPSFARPRAAPFQPRHLWSKRVDAFH
jgi:hypothetical protein